MQVESTLTVGTGGGATARVSETKATTRTKKATPLSCMAGVQKREKRENNMRDMTTHAEPHPNWEGAASGASKKLHLGKKVIENFFVFVGISCKPEMTRNRTRSLCRRNLFPIPFFLTLCLFIWFCFFGARIQNLQLISICGYCFFTSTSVCLVMSLHASTESRLRFEQPLNNKQLIRVLKLILLNFLFTFYELEKRRI